MTTRYTDRGANILFQDPQGPFVHYLDYEEVVKAVRALSAELEIDHTEDSTSYCTSCRALADARELLERLGEEV
jgi:hypothetical protein